MVGRKKLIGNQEEIRFKVSVELCKHYNPERSRLVPKAREKIALLLSPLGVSPKYVGDLWLKYKQTILDTMGNDLREAVQDREKSGRPRSVSIEQIHEPVSKCTLTIFSRHLWRSGQPGSRRW